MSVQMGYMPVSELLRTSAAVSGTMKGDNGQAANAGRSGATADQSVSISAQARGLASSDSVYRMDVGGGAKNVDLGQYFAQGATGGVGLSSIMLPTARNVSALQDHISSIFPAFLAANGIPEAPKNIRYDSEGQIVLPADYQYADKLKAALANHKGMARELQTANALASHLAGIQATEPFQKAYAAANSQAEIDAVIDQYSYLFGENRRHPQMALQFSQQGKLTITADGKALV